MIEQEFLDGILQLNKARLSDNSELMILEDIERVASTMEDNFQKLKISYAFRLEANFDGITLDILKIIDEICKKYHIKYKFNNRLFTFEYIYTHEEK